jgi:serine acetyltransferase
MAQHFFQHPQARVESASIGEDTRIWAFAHVLPGAKIGRDCNICDHTFIEDDVFIGPNASFTNDHFPRSKQHLSPESRPRTLVNRGASIGANATILPGIVIGEGAMIGAGAVVTRSVPPDAIVVGNPASISGYVGIPRPNPAADSVQPASVTETDVASVRLYALPGVEDMRGARTLAEGQSQIPFEIRRFFLVYNVPSRELRGEHAHKTLHQFLICVHGSFLVMADDCTTRREFRLDSPSQGLHIPPITWSVQYKHSNDAVVLVLASAPYDADDYIREYSGFRRLLATLS